MALIIRDKMLITFLPKTGSCWIESALKKIFLVKEIVDIGSPGWYEKHLPLGMFKGDYYRAVTVREPIEWHRSWWSFNIELKEKGINGWNVFQYLDAEDFQTHIDKVLQMFPDYYSSKILQLTGGLNNGKVNAFIRQENLNEELIRALNEGLSESFSASDLPAIKKVLVTNPEHKKLAVYRNDQPAKLKQANKTVIKMLYGEEA